jgi:hypothetical protein
MKSNLLNNHFLKTGESLSIANVFKIIEGSKEAIIKHFEKT